MQKISVIGLGYVGLPLALAIDEAKKYNVVGLDKSQQSIGDCQQGICQFDPLLNTKIANSQINYTNDVDQISGSDIFVVCVPTPVKNDYEPNLAPLKSALETVASKMSKGAIVIVESTVNPGVCDEVAIPTLEQVSGLKLGKDFEVAHCPERINPGDKKWNVYNIPRNVGASSKKATAIVANFYRSFISAEVNEVSSLKVAEATKIIENTFRDINIAYVNELAKSFDLLGIDLVETMDAAANKPFAFMPHYPGCGVGGHCIPVDPYYLIARAETAGFQHKFLKMAREVNKSMPKYTVAKAVKALNDAGLPVKGTEILLYGLSYKANVGDLRESPALIIKKELEKWGADIICYDPYLLNDSDINSLEKGLSTAQAMVVATNHQEIKDYDFSKPSGYKKIKVIIDGRNCLDYTRLPAEISYHGIGRGIAARKLKDGVVVGSHKDTAYDSESIVQEMIS